MLLLDKPFKVGQRIKFTGYDGFVEDIGMRSTRLRLLNGHTVSIPNENLAGIDIENVDARPYIRREVNLTLPFDASLEQVKRGVEILREVLSPRASVAAMPSAEDVQPGRPEEPQRRHPNEAINHPGHPPEVSFNDFNADSLNIRAVYWYSPPDQAAFAKHSELVNQEIVRRFREEDIPFGGL